ncbi:MAG: CDP-alcohol phosphatidyltransferase family protein [Phycisphaerales bacterium]|jgi:CDP-diacylglycerol--serine O-phosphatidyltransferase
MHAPPAKPRRFSLRPHTRGPRRRLRRVAMLPALLTLGNLLCGFAAIHFAAKPVAATGFFGWSTLTVAGSLIFFGMFFDAIDGFVARLVKSTSVFGANLDSLADVVSFGVAPAFMMLRLVSHYYGPDGATSIMGPEVDSVYARVAWAIAAVYICCTALRLARFNAEASAAGGEEHRTFFGLPSPGAAGAVASLIVLHQHLLHRPTAPEAELLFARASAAVIPAITLLVAFAMVSRLRYVHMTNRYLRGRHDFATLLKVVLPLAAAIWWPQITLAVGFTAYALSGPIRALRRRKPIDAAAAT